MKKSILFIATIALSLGLNAQIATPQPSPFQKIEQKVGLTDVTLEYSRPSAKGRTVVGDLVPFGKIWRTGANANTKITFSEDVEVGGKTLKAGSYAIYTKPMDATDWEVMFYNDTSNWGTPEKFDDSKVAATVSVSALPMPMDVETFTMSFDDLTSNSAVLGIMWERTYLAVPFKVMTDKTVSASIDKAMNGPTANDYYSSAVYYLESGKDIKQAKTWMDKAMSMSKEPAFWQLRQQSLIYAKAGDKKMAIEIAKKSMALAKEKGNMDYVALNEKSLKEWGAM